MKAVLSHGGIPVGHGLLSHLGITFKQVGRMVQWGKSIAWGAVLLSALAMGMQCFALKHTGNLRTIPLILFYGMLTVLFIYRTPALDKNSTPKQRIYAYAGTYLPLLLWSQPRSPDWLLSLTIPLELLGIGLTLLALSQLGSSFGIFPALRGVKSHGLYQTIRHPLYAGEALWFMAIVLQHSDWYNITLFVTQMGFQLLRIREEEATLSQDVAYQHYQAQVRYRLIPGVY
jgi:protein-S-isoprenylcysteine O-methyltransferase Ste14